MKEGDKVRITAEWDMGEIFGKFTGETIVTIGLRLPAPAQELSTRQTQASSSSNRSVAADLRVLETGIEAYCIDWSQYPQRLNQLTTPVSFITSIPVDPESKDGSPYHYERSTRKDGKSGAWDLMARMTKARSSTTHQMERFPAVTFSAPEESNAGHSIFR